MADIKKQLASPHFIGGAVGLIIILLIAGYMMFARSVSSPIIGGNDIETQTAQTSGESSLVVEDQAAGERVTIKFMDLPEGGWVAIKEVSSGRILGAARFPDGAISGGVMLLRATAAGGEYEALVYADDGDKVFDHKKDVPVVGLSTSFSAQ